MAILKESQIIGNYTKGYTMRPTVYLTKKEFRTSLKSLTLLEYPMI